MDINNTGDPAETKRHMGSKVCDTKYVYLELIYSKDNKHDVVAGLFKGILERDGNKYILLNGLKENTTNCLNTKFYKIMTIEVLKNDFRNMVYLTAEKADQDTATSMVDLLYSELMAANFGLVSDDKIIDVSKYRDVPKEYVEGKIIEKTCNTTNAFGQKATGSYTQPVNRYSGNQGANASYTKVVVKKDPEPTTFGRKAAQKPTKEAVANMLAKMDQISAGEFIPVIPLTAEIEGAGQGSNEDDEIRNIYGAGGFY